MSLSGGQLLCPPAPPRSPQSSRRSPRVRASATGCRSRRFLGTRLLRSRRPERSRGTRSWDPIARRRRRSLRSSAPWLVLTPRWGGSSTAISTASSDSRFRPLPNCAGASSRAVHAKRLRVGVWGGDPRPGEGLPATIKRDGATEVLSGVKTFCSGAGGLDRALVLARDPDASVPSAVWIDLTDSTTVMVDELGTGVPACVPRSRTASSSTDAPVLARFGPAGGSLGAAVVQPRRASDSGELGGNGRPCPRCCADRAFGAS